MEYPKASNPEMVGKYPALTFAGGGYFWDEVLEYRIWIHGPKDWFVSFPTFEEAKEAYDLWLKEPELFKEKGLLKDGEVQEEPLVLIRQREWINEPSPGVFEHQTGDRITEWQPQWLEGTQRTPEAIEQFLNNPRKPKAPPS